MEKTTLFQHHKHEHTPRNINKVHKEQQGLNDKIAVFLTVVVGSMPTAYIFAMLAMIGLAAILSWIPPFVALLVAWVSQTFIQLVLLPVIMVGQNVLNKKQELQAEEQFETTKKIYHDLEQAMLHLSKQDEELLKQTALLVDITTRIETLEEKRNVRKTRGTTKTETTD